ncbi:MAG: arginine--tRNA ligase [Alphaproteobacteria bacterium]
MRCYFTYFEEKLVTILEELQAAGTLPKDLDHSRVTVELPRDPSHGDLATNAAMVLCKQAGKKPRDLAELLIPLLQELDDVETSEIAGPGFINLRIAPAFWTARVTDILEAGTTYGNGDAGKDQAVNVEYVSANPTGPLHVGHTRGAVLGDVMASLLEKVGYAVTREYYINDAGGQIDVLAQSSYLRYCEALGEDIGEIPEGFYPGDYLKAVGESLATRFGDTLKNQTEEEWLPVVKDAALRAMMNLIREDLALLNIKHDVFTSEQDLRDQGAVEEVLALLEEKGLIYTGVLEAPKGKLVDDWEARPQTLFKATAFGDDVDRALKKSDGSWTYFAPDIAYHYDKFKRGATQMIDVLGADHGGYVKRIKSATKAITDEKANLDVQICQLVNLMEDGKPIKMSKRAGTIVNLRDIVEEVGQDVVRFIMLSRKNDTTLDFDLKQVCEKSKDNPIFYVQYAHARSCSVMRQAQDVFTKTDLSDKALLNADISILTSEAELSLIKKIAAFSRNIDLAAQHHEPHRLAYYLFDVAAGFHFLWNAGKEEANLRFVFPDNQEMTEARLALVRAVAIIIQTGLQIFGIDPLEEMQS